MQVVANKDTSLSLFLQRHFDSAQQVPGYADQDPLQGIGRVEARKNRDYLISQVLYLATALWLLRSVSIFRILAQIPKDCAWYVPSDNVRQFYTANASYSRAGRYFLL